MFDFGSCSGMLQGYSGIRTFFLSVVVPFEVCYTWFV